MLAEELFFRVFLQRYLIDHLGMWAGLLLTAIVFGAVHPLMSPSFILIAIVAGLGYSAIFEEEWSAVKRGHSLASGG